MHARTDSPLAAIIQHEISEQGTISFARFMELALYQPAWGYYRRGVDPFGRRGDFYTAEQLMPFGDLIAAQVEQSGVRQVLELGAGRRVLQGALRRWRYRGIDWDDPVLPAEFSGFVLANEFFDALPVHLLQRRNSKWVELRVASDAEGFRFRECDLIAPKLLDYAERYQPFVPADCLLEANMQMKCWIDMLRRRLRDANVLIIDYGYSAAELRRLTGGTLLSYRKHIAEPDVLRDPGERDITSHVNFTELLRLAEANGFSIAFDGSLQSWALSIWDVETFEKRWISADQRWRLQWKQLVFGMGETFRVVMLRIRASTAK